MKGVFFLLGIHWFGINFAQTKTSTFESCARDFQLDFSKSQAEIEQRFYDLRQCILGQRFPSFEATSIKGNKFSNVDFKNKVVLLNFWFISCPPCVAEMPALNEIQNEYKDKDFLLLSFGRDDSKSIEEFLKKHNADFETIPDANTLIDYVFKLRFGFPTNFILDKTGKIAEFKLGGPVDEGGVANAKEEFKRVIDAELLK